MRKTSLCIALILYNFNIILAQSEDDNIIINSRQQTYIFEENKGTIEIKEKTETYFECTKIGASLPIVEMYDNQTLINKVSSKRMSAPEYNLYTTDNMFYGDAKVCHFKLNFDRKGSLVDLKIEKTHKDPRYFTTIYLSEQQFIKEGTATILIPDWMKVELVELNFGSNITKEVKVDEKNSTHTYIYKITNEKAMKREDNMPGKSHIFPHILVLSKSSDVKGINTTYFETLDDQYAWYHTIVKDVNNDKTIIKSKADELTKDCKTEEEKIKTLFAWVQDNIRYLAFEDGIAAFKPDAAQEVLRKKYGDCKGMSNLLKCLLSSQGFDARLAWLGTNHIVYDYSTPSLSADNHMICALFFNGKTYYLDSTVKYMPLGEYPQTIQGRQTLVEDKDPGKYLLDRIPVFSPVMNTDSLYCEYSITNNEIQGKARQYYMGESKQVILSLMDATPKDKLDGALKQFLENGKSQDKASNIQISDATSQSDKVQMSFYIINKSSIQSLENEYYIDMDVAKDFMTNNIDTAKRENDLEFSYRHHIVKNIILNIPDGYKVSHIPENMDINKDGYSFSISYKQEDNKIIYRKVITISDIYLRKKRFADWNSDISRLKKAYMEQITLTKQ